MVVLRKRRIQAGADVKVRRHIEEKKRRKEAPASESGRYKSEEPEATRKRSDVGCGAGDADGLGCGRARQNNPQDDVDQEAGAGEKDRQEPENADQRRIKIKIFGQACTNTGDLLVPGGAHETLWSNDARSWCRRAGKIGAAVVAEFGAVSDFFLAIWAKHERPPRKKYSRRF